MSTGREVPAGAATVPGVLSEGVGAEGVLYAIGPGAAFEAAHQDAAAGGAREAVPAWMDQMVNEFVRERMQAAGGTANTAQRDAPAGRAADDQDPQILGDLVRQFLAGTSEEVLDPGMEFVDWLARR